MSEHTHFNYGLVIKGNSFAVHEVYLDEEDGEYKVMWTEEPVMLAGFTSRDDLLAAMYMVLEDIEHAQGDDDREHRHSWCRG